MPSSRLLLFLLVVVSAAHAGGQTEPAFGDRDPAPTSRATNNTTDQRLELLKSSLSAWPESRAVDAVYSLVAMGEPVIPVLLTWFDSNDWRIRTGVAFALGEMRAREGFDVVRRGINDVANLIAQEVWMRSLVKIDPDEGAAEILRHLFSPSHRTSMAAFEAMPKELPDSMRSAIVAGTQDRNPEVRRRFIVLLYRLKTPEPPDLLFDVLDDRSPRIARFAAETLSRRNDPETSLRLLELATTGTLRKAAYATLAICLMDDRLGIYRADLPEPLIQRWIKWLDIRSDLENAVGAAALARYSLVSTNTSVRKLAEEVLAPKLIVACWGGVIFADYSSVRDVCLGALEQISGEEFRDNGEKWKTWWMASRGKFSPQRRLVSLKDVAAREISLERQRRHKDGGDERLVLATSLERVVADLPDVALWVEEAELLELTNSLEAAGLFRGGETGGADAEVWRIQVGRSEVSVRSTRGASPAFDEISARIDQLAARNYWQHFRIGESATSAMNWLREHKEVFQTTSRDSWHEKVLEAALRCFGGATDRTRRLVLECLETSTQVQIAPRRGVIADLLRDRRLKPPEAVQIVRVLRRMDPPAPALDLLQVVGSRGPDFAAALTFLLDECPVDELRRALKDARAPTDATLARALAGKLPDAVAVEGLLDLVRAPGSAKLDVFLAALLGRDPAPLNGRLLEMSGDSRSPAAPRAIEMLGALASQEAIGSLGDRFLTSDGPRRAFLRGLNRQTDVAAPRYLVYLLETVDSDALRFDVLTALTASTHPETKNEIRDYLSRESVPARLIAAFPAAAGVLGADAPAAFIRFLTFADPEVRRRSALLLGSRGHMEAASELVEWLGDRASSLLAREYLEFLTSRSVDSLDAAALKAGYRRILELHPGGTWREYFVSALRDLKIPVTDIENALTQGEPLPAAVNSLIALLKSEHWYIRANAHRLLTEWKGGPASFLTPRTKPDDITRMSREFSEWAARSGL